MNENAIPSRTVLARVDGWPIHLSDLPSAVTRITDMAANLSASRKGFTVFTLNVDHLVKLRTQPAFQDAYRRADLVTADGAPVAWLSRFDDPAITRTTGADMFAPLVNAAALKGLPIYMFGSTPQVLAKTSERLMEETRGRVKIAGIASPSATFNPEGPEADAAIAQIKASGARLCFVALGAPKQEVFSARAVAQGCTAGFICVGAAVDFVAGAQVRAPELFQSIGMEWAWRLATNPKRLARRYAECARVLVDVVVFAPVRQGLLAREI